MSAGWRVAICAVAVACAPSDAPEATCGDGLLWTLREDRFDDRLVGASASIGLDRQTSLYEAYYLAGDLKHPSYVREFERDAQWRMLERVQRDDEDGFSIELRRYGGDDPETDAYPIEFLRSEVLADTVIDWKRWTRLDDEVAGFSGYRLADEDRLLRTERLVRSEGSTHWEVWDETRDRARPLGKYTDEVTLDADGAVVEQRTSWEGELPGVLSEPDHRGLLRILARDASGRVVEERISYALPDLQPSRDRIHVVTRNTYVGDGDRDFVQERWSYMDEAFPVWRLGTAWPGEGPPAPRTIDLLYGRREIEDMRLLVEEVRWFPSGPSSVMAMEETTALAGELPDPEGVDPLYVATWTRDADGLLQELRQDLATEPPWGSPWVFDWRFTWTSSCDPDPVPFERVDIEAPAVFVRPW